MTVVHPQPPSRPAAQPRNTGLAQKVTCWFPNIADTHSPIANV